jgi:hypothetical protein
LGFDASGLWSPESRKFTQAIRSGLIADFTTDQFNNQTAMRAMAAAAGGQLAPIQFGIMERAEAKPSESLRRETAPKLVGKW